MIFDINWWLSLTSHQLDVVRTMATVIGSALIPMLGFLLAWIVKVVRATRKDAEKAKEQTAHVEYVDGKERVVSVTEYARHAMNSGEAARHETGDLAQWLRGRGKYRAHTADVPRQEPTHYE